MAETGHTLIMDIEENWRAEECRRQGISMAGNLKEAYVDEKKNLRKLLAGARMTDVCYGETFYLLFTQNFGNGVNLVNQQKEMCFQLVIDAPCWFGDRDEWLERVKTFGIGDDSKASEDCLLACELTRLRYWNLIDVEKIDFLEDHLSITFPEGNILSVLYDGDADCEWYLEEISSQKESERISIGCCGNELFQNNVGIISGNQQCSIS